MSEIPNPSPKRDGRADYRKAVEDAIALAESLGQAPSPYLLVQLAEMDAAWGNPHPVEHTRHEPELERKDLEPAAERAVPRRPGRPRKVTE